MTEYRPFHNNSWSGFISSKLNEMDFAPEKLAGQGELIVCKPNRMVRRLDLAGMTVYAKWFAPPKSIIKRVLRKPLVFKLLNIHQAMLSSEIGCAEPLLAAVSGDISQEKNQLFVYKEVPYPSITQRLQREASSRAADIYQTAAQAIATLHNAGFVHGDCLPGNICLSDDGKAFFIDNDRTVRSLPILHAWQERRNLIQFCAHAALQQIMSREMQHCFLARYFDFRSQKLPSLATLLDRIEARRQEIQRQKGNATQKR